MKLSLIPIAFAGAALLAQGPGGPRMHPRAEETTTDVQSYLNLTDAQITSLKQLRTSEMDALKPIFQQIGPLRQTLFQEEQSSNPDASAISKTIQSIQALEQQMTPIRTNYQQQATALLTPDQVTKLAALQSAAALMPAIHEAAGLNLLTPPKGAGPGGFGFGAEFMPRGRFGPR